MIELTDKQIWEKSFKNGKSKLFETSPDNSPYKKPSIKSHTEFSNETRIKRLEKQLKELTKTIEDLEAKMTNISKFSKLEAMKRKKATINNINIQNQNQNENKNR